MTYEIEQTSEGDWIAFMLSGGRSWVMGRHPTLDMAERAVLIASGKLRLPKFAYDENGERLMPRDTAIRAPRGEIA